MAFRLDKNEKETQNRMRQAEEFVRSRLRRYASPDLDDAIQNAHTDTLNKVFEDQLHYNRHLLWRVRKRHYDIWRRDKRRRKNLEDYKNHEYTNPRRHLPENRLVEFHELFSRLPENHLKVLQMFYYDNLPGREIAEQLGIEGDTEFVTREGFGLIRKARNEFRRILLANNFDAHDLADL